MDSLRLTFWADSDGTGELSAQVSGSGFSGVSSAWFGIGQVEEFARHLAAAYPLQPDHPHVLEGGFWEKSGASRLEQQHLELRFYPIGVLGRVGCRVALSTPIYEHDRPGSQSSVVVELQTTYERTRTFALALELLAKGAADEAVLDTEA